jgi:hypothetical protein
MSAPTRVTFLALCAGSYQGQGVNHEGQDFDAAFTINPPRNTHAVVTHYRAAALAGELFHEDHMFVGLGPAGTWQAVSASNNIPGLQYFAVAIAGAQLTLTHGDLSDLASFREVITLKLQASGEIHHQFAWAMPGQTLRTQSECLLVKQGK